MTALPDFTCSSCGKRWLAKPAPGTALVWSPVDTTTEACATCLKHDPPKRGVPRSGLRVVGRMRARDANRRAERGEAPVPDVPLGTAVQRAGKFLGELLGGKPKPPKEPRVIEAHGEVTDDDEHAGGAARKVVSGK